MRKIRFLLYAALACYYLSYFIPYKVIDPELAPYEKEFLDTVHLYCNDNQFYSNPRQETLIINDLGNNIQIAYCSYNLVFSHFEITFNSRFWKSGTEDERYSSLIHEFTHCYFHEGHSKDPYNYMYAYENNLTKNVVKKQLEQLAKKKCSK